MSSVLLTAIQDVCRDWSESLPLLTQVPGSIEISLHAIKNTRRKMEDRHAVCVDVNSLFGLQVCLNNNITNSYSLCCLGLCVYISVLLLAQMSSPPPQDYPPQAYYAVFDGHVAVEAADYASVHVLPNIVKHEDFKTDPASALKRGILTTDQRFCKIVSTLGFF